MISDAPVPPTVRVRAHNHLLGECGITFFAASALARTLKRRLPASLTGAPAIVGEFDDSALMKVFGENGVGAFAAEDAETLPTKRARR